MGNRSFLGSHSRNLRNRLWAYSFVDALGYLKLAWVGTSSFFSAMTGRAQYPSNKNKFVCESQIENLYHPADWTTQTYSYPFDFDDIVYVSWNETTTSYSIYIINDSSIQEIVYVYIHILDVYIYIYIICIYTHGTCIYMYWFYNHVCYYCCCYYCYYYHYHDLYLYL